MQEPVIILGLGFTTQRLARILRERDIPVYAIVRGVERFGEFAALGVQLRSLDEPDVPSGAVLVHTIPPLPEPEKTLLRRLIRRLSPRRIVYISSTGVYGAQTHVDESSLASAGDDKGRARVDDEEWIARDGGWTSLILRSAAIYGPGRGIHMRIREGKLPRGAGGVVSRIHVDDLAALLFCGIFSVLEGAFAVADDLPASSEEVAEWCANLMRITMPDDSAPGFPVAGRHVDGKKIRELLGVRLRYPSYKEGIAASLLEESLGGR